MQHPHYSDSVNRWLEHYHHNEHSRAQSDGYAGSDGTSSLPSYNDNGETRNAISKFYADMNNIANSAIYFKSVNPSQLDITSVINFITLKSFTKSNEDIQKKLTIFLNSFFHYFSDNWKSQYTSLFEELMKIVDQSKKSTYEDLLQYFWIKYNLPIDRRLDIYNAKLLFVYNTMGRLFYIINNFKKIKRINDNNMVINQYLLLELRSKYMGDLTKQPSTPHIPFSYVDRLFFDPPYTYLTPFFNVSGLLQKASAQTSSKEEEVSSFFTGGRKYRLRSKRRRHQKRRKSFRR